MIWRWPHIAALIVGALLWVALWYGAAVLIHWLTGGRYA